ncbi:TPA: TetR/AcrR family transcriptional regulator [Enterobacter hormaechei subsp. steigerwaltii]|nr:TetR/AcrR family transcriptional regulator [Enterobacter hormaechei subsp. steigerwaltii]
MAKRDAAATRRKLLDAAVKEFAAHGLAGARVDRIAAATGISKPMLYAYFGDKEALFDAALTQEVMEAASADLFDAEDLPGYAGRMYDLLSERHCLWRLITWFHLERGQDVLLISEGREILRTKLERLIDAQVRGHITADFRPEVIVRILTTLIQLWCMAPPAMTSEDHQSRRETIVLAVQRLFMV